MSVITQDLWPESFGIADEVPPVTILRAQASLLGTKTKNIVEAQVKSQPTLSDGLDHQLFVVAPALGNYKYLLLSVRQGLMSYPLTVNAAVLGKTFPVKDQEQFLEVLGQVFSSPETARVVANLLAMSQTTPQGR
ncbi:MAG: hypothetical protein K2R98_06640 [Gemmataceae bacterium]|nr:hypothetical protein [Gemmataceae bacterium]